MKLNTHHISRDEAINLYYSGRVIKKIGKNGTLTLLIGTYVNRKPRYINTQSTIKILQELNLIYDNTLNSKLFKQKIAEYLLANYKPFEILTTILNKHVSLRKHQITDSNKLIRTIFDLLEFKYNIGKHNALYVKEGSFCIDGNWIHIG